MALANDMLFIYHNTCWVPSEKVTGSGTAPTGISSLGFPGIFFSSVASAFRGC